MGRKRQDSPEGKRARVTVVKRRKPRDGARISVAMRLVVDRDDWLSQEAARQRTNKCEIIMDLVDAKRAQLDGIAAKRSAGEAA